MIQEHHIKVEKTARFFTLGNLGKNTKSIWFVFHGYGQLSSEFISEFEDIIDGNNYVVAIEASNKFYLRGFSGKIGATWMTKEDRQNEIDDYIDMIETVHKEITLKVDTKNTKINVLGFSQGTHTCVRWMDRKHPNIDRLILWAGGIPRDCNYEKNREFWSHIKTSFVVGNSDKFITQEVIDKEIKYFQSQNFVYNFIRFNGRHKLDKQTLKSLVIES